MKETSRIRSARPSALSPDFLVSALRLLTVLALRGLALQVRGLRAFSVQALSVSALELVKLANVPAQLVLQKKNVTAPHASVQLWVQQKHSPYAAS
jgi:hypothetical protein